MKRIINILVWASALLLSLPAKAETTQDSLTVWNDLPYFDQIDVTNIDVQYVEGESNSIALYNEFKEEVDLRWEVEGKTLVIKLKPNKQGEKKRHFKFFGFEFSNSHNYESYPAGVRLVITGPTLKGCILNGFGTCEIGNLCSDGQVKIVANGSATAKIGNIKAPKAYLGASGASHIHAKVETPSLSVAVSGASDAEIQGNAPEAYVLASGACHINMKGTYDSLTASASGASDIHVKGSVQKRNFSTSGVSNISVETPKSTSIQ